MMKRARWVSAVAILALSAGCASSGAPSSGSFFASIQQNAAATRQDENAVIDDLARIARGRGSQRTLDGLGSDAQALHDHLNDYHDQIISAASPESDTEISLAVAVNDLTEVNGLIADWTENPTAAGATRFKDKLGPAIGEWNSAVRALWRSQNAGPAPTIKRHI